MTSSPAKDLSEVLQNFLTATARFLVWAGGLATVAAVGLLLFTCFRVSGGQGVNMADAMRNVEMFGKILIPGLLALGVGSSYLFWGEEVLGVVQLLFAAALWFAPIYVPSLLGGNTNEVVGRAMGALQQGGGIFGAIAVIVLVVDLTNRARNRAKIGVKADQLKYGKGIKEDADRQNVFMGKCWQLPYCRKFVRERCPIFHAQRTCWKERVGCMCEEEVIRSAMENKPIPKDALLANNMIPRNHRLTEEQKAERCRNCVIYNEHQRHKYRLFLPLTLLGFIAFYGIFRGPLLMATGGLLEATNRVINLGTLGATKGMTTPPFFVEMLLIIFLIVGLSYALKILELLIFKLKV